MLRNILTLARLSMRLTFNRRSSYVTFLIMPLLFTFLIGQASGSRSDDDTVAWPLWVLNEDNGQLGNILLQHLQEEPNLEITVATLEEGKASVSAENAIAFLVIPTEFSQNLAEGVTLDLYIDPANTRSIQPIEQIILATAGELGGALSAAAFSVNLAERFDLFNVTGDEQTTYFDEGVTEALTAWETPPIIVSAQPETTLESAVIPDGTNQSAPGMTVMFAMFLMLGGAATLVI